MSSGELDFEAVRRLLPQSFPLLLVDRVVECEPGKRLRAYKNVSGNDLHFIGHFPDRDSHPGHAIMPGVLVLEALAQASVLLFQLTYGPLAAEEQAVLGSVKARFLLPVLPGDRLELETVAEKMTASAGVFQVAATVEGKEVARGTLSMAKSTHSALAASRRGQGSASDSGEA